MANENGTWIMRGPAWNDPKRIKTWKELIEKVKEVGFLPLFANEIKGFSVEEHVSPNYWWTGNRKEDPWEWREIIAASHEVAYGKFFDKKAGFISVEWLPYFANYRRDGYDFMSRWEDGLADRREKKIMDFFVTDDDGEAAFKDTFVLSTELKEQAGFGKNGEKNYPGIMTNLQMATYLVISEFRRRRNKKGDEYGMAVSVPLPPEKIWGYNVVTAAYKEQPAASWDRIAGRITDLYPAAAKEEVSRLIGKRP